MAKRIITESYVFNPSTRTVIIVGKYIRQEQLLLVTNVTQNTVIYNFSDPTLGYTSFSQLTTGSNESTTVILSYNTSAQSATDKLAILVEEADETLRPSETLMDPVGKMRTSSAQSLIDTDFEYGSQPTKWESGSLLSNRASSYFDATTGLQIGGMQSLQRGSTGSYQVQVTSATFPTTGTQVWPQTNGSLFVQGSLDSEKVDGWWLASSAAGYSAGTGLVITAVISGGILTGTQTVTVQGTGYALNDIIRLDQNGATAAAVVYVSAVTASIGAVTQVTIITGGSGFTAAATTSTVIGTGHTGTNSTATVAHAAITAGSNVLSTLTLPTAYSALSGALLVGTGVAHPSLPNGTVISAVLASGYALSNAATAAITLNTGLYFAPVAFYNLLTAVVPVLSGAGTSLSDYSKGYIYSGSFYSGAGIPVQYDMQTAVATSISYSSTTITVKNAYPHGLALNDQVMIANLSATTNAPNGTFTVASVPTTNSFTYTASAIPTGNITIGDCFITACSSATLGASSIITSTVTGTPQVGQLLIAASTAVDANTFITSVSGASQTFTIGLSKPLLAAATAVNMHASSMLNCVFPRTMGYVAHRAFDGGVQFTNQRPFHGYTVYRQTRRYFRYQSGKGIQFSTGSILRPSIPVESITSALTTATVTTRIPHGLEAGSTVTISGATQPDYNISAVTATVPTQTTFTYTLIVSVSNATARNFDDSSGIQVSPALWYGAKNRIGMFDSQNGFFFEYDGQQLYAVRRTSTAQIQGYATFTPGSSTVVGSGTLFGARLKTGDMIVARGMSYLVTGIATDTVMTISPEYRGSSNITQCSISKTIDIRIPQSQWNIDKANGTGPSGYNIDLSKMQMWYMDYSWYGAGSIRFGIKNARGEVIYLHRIVNSNQNTEAYMRSGNLPARYETSTVSLNSYLTGALATGTTQTAFVANAAGWPTTGTVLISDKFNQGFADSNATSYTVAQGTQAVSVSTINSGTFTPGMILTGTTTVFDTNTVITGVSGAGGSGSVLYISKPLLGSTNAVTMIGTGPSTGTVLEYANYTSLSAATTFVGSISGNVLTVSSVSSGSITANSFISTTSSTIPGVLPGTQIGTFMSGGGSGTTGTYPVNIAQNVPSCTMTGGPWSMGISARSQTGGGSNVTISAPTALTGPFANVSLHSPLQASTISHWGSSVIMDGRYDDDKSLIFGAGLASPITFATAGVRRALISLRISPSVDSGVTGLVGQREILNRMQMVLRQIDCVTTTASFRLDLILNGIPSGASLPSWQAVGGSSLAQVAYHTSGLDVINFGENIYTFFTTSSGVTQQDLNLVRDLGTSVLGGGRASAMPSGSRLNIYPDGPDVVTLVATPLLANGTIISRISWTEAQA